MFKWIEIREIREIGINIKNINVWFNIENVRFFCGSVNVCLLIKSLFWLLIYSCSILMLNWNCKYFFNCVNFGVFYDVYRGNK